MDYQHPNLLPLYGKDKTDLLNGMVIGGNENFTKNENLKDGILLLFSIQKR